ncbi:hypothetical protein VPH234P10_0094 [Vibrio phage 234P10]|nr:hypothetical protein SIPHO062v1_p0042 [Vibrio phage PS17B.1]QZI92693.1 hypothetical protein SIPHO010v1_p0006 [Vibrio phage 268E42.1]
MIRVTIIDSGRHVLYTLDSDYEMENVRRICSFNTSPFALKEIQERKERVVQAGGATRIVKPCPPDEWLNHETYESLNRLLQGHTLPLEGQFLYAEMREAKGAKIPLQFIHDAYCLFCERNLRNPVPLKTLGKLLRDHYDVETKQTSFKGRNVTCAIGYELL